MPRLAFVSPPCERAAEHRDRAALAVNPHARLVHASVALRLDRVPQAEHVRRVAETADVRLRTAIGVCHLCGRMCAATCEEGAR